MSAAGNSVSTGSDYTALPCPFCGSKPVVAAAGYATIHCADADCFGPRTTAQYLTDALAQWNKRSGHPAQPQPERCPSCFGTDADYALGAYKCTNPWHGDDHLRAKTLARQTTTSVLPRREGQAAECDGGLRTFDTTGTVFRRTGKVLTITCESDEIANKVADQLRSPAYAAKEPADAEAVAKAMYDWQFGAGTWDASQSSMKDHYVGLARAAISSLSSTHLSPGAK